MACSLGRCHPLGTDMRFLPAVVTGTTTKIGPKLPEPIPRRPEFARTHPRVEIPGRGGKLPGTTKVDADLALSAEQSTAQGPCRAAHLHPSGVAPGHGSLIRDRRLSAVLTSVLPGRATP